LDLRETIDFLKKKNSEAQAVIQGALNASEATPKGRIAVRVNGTEKGQKWREGRSLLGPQHTNSHIYFLEGEGP
jgi:hypothetical protein